MGRSKKQFRIAINLKTGQENIKYQDKHDQGYLESKSVRSIVKKLYPKIMQAADMRAGINDIKVGLDNLSARIAELCEAMQYGPGGPVARDAQAHFESLLKPE
jgi:hypothetical protein